MSSPANVSPSFAMAERLCRGIGFILVIAALIQLFFPGETPPQGLNESTNPIVALFGPYGMAIAEGGIGVILLVVAALLRKRAARAP